MTPDPNRKQKFNQQKEEIDKAIEELEGVRKNIDQVTKQKLSLESMKKA